MEGLMEYDPDARLSARQALKHPYFRELRDADKRAAKQARQSEDLVAAPVRRDSQPAPTVETTDGRLHADRVLYGERSWIGIK
jgi:serine/threonine protein kinase